MGMGRTFVLMLKPVSLVSGKDETTKPMDLSVEGSGRHAVHLLAPLQGAALQLRLESGGRGPLQQGVIEEVDGRAWSA